MRQLRTPENESLSDEDEMEMAVPQHATLPEGIAAQPQSLSESEEE